MNAKMTFMRRLAALFALVAFSAWILPLGDFIRPSEESSACGGKRAFHMCRMKPAAPKAGVVSIQAPAAASEAAPKEASSSCDATLQLPAGANALSGGIRLDRREGPAAASFYPAPFFRPPISPAR